MKAYTDVTKVDILRALEDSEKSDRGLAYCLTGETTSEAQSRMIDLAEALVLDGLVTKFEVMHTTFYQHSATYRRVLARAKRAHV